MLKSVESAPHVAVIQFNVFVHRLLHDGSLDPEIVNCEEEFQKLGMSNEAELSVSGFDKEECLRLVKEKLERLAADDL